MRRHHGEPVELCDAEPKIHQAVERLLAAPREFRCFVIIQDEVTDRFVQFGTFPKDNALFIDTGYQQLRQPYGCIARPVSLPEAADHAMRILRHGLDLPETAVLWIRDETSTAPEERN